MTARRTTQDLDATIDEPTPRRTMTGRTTTVMVVDDDSVVLEGFCRAAARSGSSLIVHTAFSAESALLRLTALASAGTPPDCIVTDYYMPGMNGQNLIRTLRMHPGLGDLPVMVMTGYDDPASRAEIARLNVVRLPKGGTGASFDAAVGWALAQGSRTR